MNSLEIYSGTESISKELRKVGFDTTTVDDQKQFDPTFCCDMLKFDYKQWDPGYFRFIWASPPCTCFSLSACGHHWQPGYVPNPETLIAMELVKKAIEIIEYFQPPYWYIENPRAMLSKLDFMQFLPKNEIWYCQYGDVRAKPTHIWGDFPDEFPVRKCYNFTREELDNPELRHCHHDPAPRGSPTGTQGMTSVEAATIPQEFCRMLSECVRNELDSGVEREFILEYQLGLEEFL